MRKVWPNAKRGKKLGELRERVRSLEEWNDGTLSDRDQKYKRGQR
jgi:hypothetical protein